MVISSICRLHSSQISTQHCIYAAINMCSTQVEQTFHMYEWSLRIRCTVFFKTSSWAPDSYADMCPSSQITAATIFTSFSSMMVNFWPGCRSSFAKSPPSVNSLYQHNIVALHSHSSSEYTFFEFLEYLCSGPTWRQQYLIINPCSFNSYQKTRYTFAQSNTASQ